MCYLRSLVRVLAREYIIKVMEIRQYNATSICIHPYACMFTWHYCWNMVKLWIIIYGIGVL